MIHKWLEEWYETGLYLLLIAGGTFFFLWYWVGQCQVRYAEVVLEDFLTEVSVDGKITLEEYEKVIWNLEKINPEYTMEIRCVEYEMQPVLIPRDRLKEYYEERNIRNVKEFSAYPGMVQWEDADSLCLQTESNETILAAESKDWLPLPDDDREECVAVRPYQELYEGENLITLCRVHSKEGVYYTEAEEIKAYSSGTVYLRLAEGGKEQLVPVEVLCHPRRVLCNHGHVIVNSVNVLEKSKEKGELACPFCETYPERMECVTALLYKKTGQRLTSEEIQIKVTYLDGHEEIITPETEEWQDSFDTNFCGLQPVTVYYRGMEEVFSVITENDVCKACGKTCNERCYSDYVSFPYCVDCMSGVELFSGEIFEEEQWTSTKELVACLDESGEYVLQTGDMILVYVKKKKQYQTLLYKKIMRDGKEG